MLLADLVGRAVGDDPALAHQQQPVAPLGLVHDVAGDEHGAARRPRAGGRAPTGRGAAPGRGRPSARRAPAGRGRRAGRRRGWPGCAGRPRGGPTTWSRWSSRSTASMASSTCGAVDAEHAGEEGEVLRDGEVVVDARGLGDVADAGPQRPGCPRARPSTSTVPDRTCCAPTRHRISVDLPQPLGPSRPVTPAGHVERDAGQHLALAAYDDEVAHRHDVIHHVLNCAPGVAPGVKGSRRCRQPGSADAMWLTAELGGACARRSAQVTGQVALERRAEACDDVLGAPCRPCPGRPGRSASRSAHHLAGDERDPHLGAVDDQGGAAPDRRRPG